MKKYLWLMLVAGLLLSCKTQQLYLNVTEPAVVTLPPGVHSAGIVDRSEASKEAKALDAIDKVLTLEGAGLDRAGADAAIEGLASKLVADGRITELKRINEKFDAVHLAGPFPPPIDWTVVDRVCSENSVDILFSLEAFDTDTRINYQVIKGGPPKTLLGAVTGVEHRADMQTLVKTAWRIYYPSRQTVLDEFPVVHSLNFSATGLTPVVAAAALIDRKEAVKKVGIRAGEIYASRIIPYQIEVERDYYVKGTDNFRTAMRKARTGKWDEAGDLWRKETQNPSGKIAGRAHYNMAIIEEINGNLPAAREWAEKAYENYNLRKALKYVRIIENRMRENELLQIQEERQYQR
ncbi:MAG TPA: DUF6340 family protein [Bacteroidales bacterium]|nr:DUF6340 family protein [Bacteroidales bacterium]HRR92544.1 DUF6340 family protein [Bacteroidales bacterium]HRT90496.1 DUF6340 family protein [Bacteroidales bacterium]